MYYTLSSKTEAREADELAGTASTRLTMRMRGGELPRLWLMRLAQMPLAYSAPHECLQYYTADNGNYHLVSFFYVFIFYFMVPLGRWSMMAMAAAILKLDFLR